MSDYRLSSTSLLLMGLASLLIVPAIWAQELRHDPDQTEHGAAHERHFSDIEKSVQMFEGAPRDAWQKPDEVVKYLRLRPGDVVADIGAGTGYFTRRFAAVVGEQGRAIGLDIEPSMVTYINAEAIKQGITNLSARQVPADDPLLAARSVDVVFICDTYHHMQARVAYARLLARALKPGGRVVVIDFHKRPLPLGPPMKWKLTPEAVVGEFRQAGFQLAQSADFLPYQYLLEFEVSPTD